MKIGSQEHYDMLDQFEKSITHSGAYSLRFEREDKSLWRLGHFYQHGQTNLYFQAFSLGYTAARCVYMQETS